MNRVRVLPDQVANQIAAGEVIERPASVVKELVENSIDAEARKISVEIQAGGRALIRVTDDGIGMNRDDALMSLERHGTSKLRLAEDLSSISTMGFRGEAIPSIASVSRFTLTTRERGDDSPDGTEIVIDGGKLQDVKSAGRAPGATVEVRQLFFNLPARRKFLKSQETERAHIQHYLALAALAHPEIAFDFRQENRLVWRLPAVAFGDDIESRQAALRDRLRELYGSEVEMLPVDHADELDLAGGGEALARDIAARVWGFIGAPGVSRSTRQDQHLFVNRRPIENRGLNHALIEGYQTALAKGRFPMCCLFLEMDPDSVDVNIHPAKREVKFHREREVRRLVAEAVETALRGMQRVETEDVPAPEAAGADEGGPVETDAAPQAQPFPVVAGERTVSLEVSGSAEGGKPKSTATEPDEPAPAVASAGVKTIPEKQSERFDKEPDTASKLEAVEAEMRQSPVEPAPLMKVPLRILGVVARNYIALESDRGLVLMDQRAAHERVLYEQMLDAAETASAPSQRLLLPETVELSVRDAQFVREQIEALSKLGVGLSEFGEQTFLLDALPPFVQGMEARRFVLELVDDLKAAGQSANSNRLTERMIARTICHRAVNAGVSLSGPELEKLVESLRRCAMPYTCPNGRPTLIEINERELARKFGRSV
jgi:DNA mismatch repair protein MutL